MKGRRVSIVSLGVALVWMQGLAIGVAAQGAPGRQPSVMPLKPFTAQVPALPAKVSWDMDKVRIEMGAGSPGKCN